MTIDEFWEFILSEKCFEEHDVSYIDDSGHQHYLKQEDIYEYSGAVVDLMSSSYTLKIEQMERVFTTSGTAHMFYNKADGPSFDLHTDPVDVVINCHDGIKHMEVDGKSVIIEKGKSLRIPKGTEHRALNTTEALMVSYGINDTETLSSIREDNRDL